jgi:dTDP-4-dehydrorhamnose reductase
LNPLTTMPPEHDKKRSSNSNHQSLQLWGGLECTVARVHDTYRDQIEETGHQRRAEDLDNIAALGIRTLRYPVLLDTISPDTPDHAKWEWHDERLGRLQKLGIEPIAGLVHHGSGPPYTSLTDPAFPEIVARHAARVATRYPWISMYTPVNEPLTTARFSGLYGHWYPHGHDIPTFLRTLVTQCRAVVLSMQAIRRIRPDAILVQTEDMGKTFATSRLQYQADYENERRWLSFDLLCGRIDRQHSWHKTFIDSGITEQELDFFIEAKCVPDIFGINHYLTSERFLDDRVALYPEYHHALNGRHTYADVEAVRIDFPPGTTGPEARLREVWERYGQPIVVTEAHHGCTRDEQLRWLVEVWQAAKKLQAEGVDLRAVTVWSLFGALDWNTLLVQKKGFYEPGAFDTRANPPRATALATAAQSLATTGAYDHPVLDLPGWWKRDERFYQPKRRSGPLHLVGSPRRLLITGATGTLGKAMSKICTIRGLDHDLIGRKDMDIADQHSVDTALALYKPWAVINTAGYVRVADAENESDACFRENADGAAILARACAAQGIPYLSFSSDLVFDGSKNDVYLESDTVNPVGMYGKSKARAEAEVLAAHPAALVVRTSAFFGPWDTYNFAFAMLRDLAAGTEVSASDALIVSPTYVPDLAHACLDLLVDGASGIWHLANQGSVSWYGFALRLARHAGLPTDLIIPVHGDKGMTALSSERGLIMPTLERGIDSMMHDCRGNWRAPLEARGGATV